MSIFDSFGRLFGRPATPAFQVPAGKDPMQAMMEAEARRFGASAAPQPTPESLKAILAKATRVKIVEGGMFMGEPTGSTAMLDTSDPDDMQGLRDRLRIEKEPGGHCSCLGGHTMEIFAGSKRIAVFGLHHGDGLRWEMWKNDAKISGADVFVSWLQHHGILEPFEELRKARHSQRISMVAQSKWTTAAPAVLKPVLADAMRGEINVTELLLNMDAQVGDESEKARQLFRWLGGGHDKWSGGPAYQMLPEMMLVKFRRQVLVEALLNDDGDIILEKVLLDGAGRFFSGEIFLKERAGDLAHFSRELKDALRSCAKASGDAEKLQRIDAMLKAAAQAPPPKPEAPKAKKKAADDDDEDDAPKPRISSDDLL